MTLRTNLAKLIPCTFDARLRAPCSPYIVGRAITASPEIIEPTSDRKLQPHKHLIITSCDSSCIKRKRNYLNLDHVVWIVMIQHRIGTCRAAQQPLSTHVNCLSGFGFWLTPGPATPLGRGMIRHDANEVQRIASFRCIRMQGRLQLAHPRRKRQNGRDTTIERGIIAMMKSG